VTSGVNIDTSDPQVQRLMGLEQREQHRFANQVERGHKELVHIAGDADTGMTSTIDLSAAAGKSEVFATYRGRFVPPEFPDGLRLTIDVYAIPNEPTQVHLICPKCRKQLRATSDRKQVNFELRPQSPEGGLLEVSPFQCTWEMPEAGEHVAGIRSGGLTLCQWKGVIDHVHGKNVVRDA
jgi:hypothetical protein